MPPQQRMHDGLARPADYYNSSREWVRPPAGESMVAQEWTRPCSMLAYGHRGWAI